MRSCWILPLCFAGRVPVCKSAPERTWDKFDAADSLANTLLQMSVLGNPSCLLWPLWPVVQKEIIYVACISSVDGPICSNRSNLATTYILEMMKLDGTSRLLHQLCKMAPFVLQVFDKSWTHYNSLALHVSDDAIFLSYQCLCDALIAALVQQNVC